MGDITTLEPRPPWEQRAGEHDHQYAWFVRYAELGEGRTLERTSALQGVPEKLVREAASSFAWADRAGAYDRAVAQIAATVQIDESSALATQGAVGQALLRLGMEKAKLINPSMLKVKDMRELLQLGAELIRKGAGLADFTVDNRTASRVEDEFLDLLED